MSWKWSGTCWKIVKYWRSFQWVLRKMHQRTISEKRFSCFQGALRLATLNSFECLWDDVGRFSRLTFSVLIFGLSKVQHASYHQMCITYLLCTLNFVRSMTLNLHMWWSLFRICSDFRSTTKGLFDYLQTWDCFISHCFCKLWSLLMWSLEVQWENVLKSIVFSLHQSWSNHLCLSCHDTRPNKVVLYLHLEYPMVQFLLL